MPAIVRANLREPKTAAVQLKRGSTRRRDGGMVGGAQPTWGARTMASDVERIIHDARSAKHMAGTAPTRAIKKLSEAVEQLATLLKKREGRPEERGGDQGHDTEGLTSRRTGKPAARPDW
jgi:hypothetical protein